MSTSNLLLSNPFPTSLWGDKTTIKGLKYTWSKSEISVDVNTWIYPRVDIPEFPLTELSGVSVKVDNPEEALADSTDSWAALKLFASRAIKHHLILTHQIHSRK
ncbi:unnamed protein product [Cuscuta epithymum]|uniref:Uncharacterized protein n=1 Tax=Cuscuta epithymum TaxID=186058 RepID=A0AAV0DEL9_9ASTE|nr:unnamed protein product [Cuscuta epithymum]